MTEPLAVDQVFIRKLTDIVLANLQNEDFNVTDLARESGMSLYTLSRRLHSFRKKTVNQFIREVRLQKALEMLQEGTFTAAEVAYRAGFGSPAYFNKRFHEFFGYPPGEVTKSDLKSEDESPVTRDIPEQEQKIETKRNLILKMLVFLLLACSIVLIVFQIFTSTSTKRTIEDFNSSGKKITVAVMPFLNMTNDPKWDIWQNGLQTNLIYRLTNSEEIKVRQTETVNSLLQSKGYIDFASLTPSVASAIARKLDAEVFIYGSINEAGNKIRVNAAILNSKSKEALKSFQLDGTSEKIIDIVDSVSDMIKNSLLISQLYKKYSPGYNTNITNSPDAFRYFIQGQAAFNKHDFITAIDWYQQALKIDSNLIQAISGISRAYYDLSLFGKPVLDQGKSWCLRYSQKVRMMTPADKIYADWLYTGYFQTPYDRIKYMDQLKEIDDQNPATYFNLGDAHLELFQYNDAIVEFKRAIEIYDKWGEKAPIMYYQELGQDYRRAGRYKEEKKLYRKAKKYYPDAPDLLEQYAYVAFSEGDTAEANWYIKKWTLFRREQSWSDADIISALPWIYEMAGMPDNAEVFFRLALSLEPENADKMNSLAYFLIDKDRNIDEGMELVNKSLELNPDSYSTLSVKGWGLYKQGKYKEALDMLQKSWDIRLQKAIYNHTAFLHLQAAKKAVGGQR
jgi:AraC-like DNA-binding protein/tetratricopeptide (TPR) repeat protein